MSLAIVQCEFRCATNVSRVLHVRIGHRILIVTVKRQNHKELFDNFQCGNCGGASVSVGICGASPLNHAITTSLISGEASKRL